MRYNPTRTYQFVGPSVGHGTGKVSSFARLPLAVLCSSNSFLNRGNQRIASIPVHNSIKRKRFDFKFWRWPRSTRALSWNLLKATGSNQPRIYSSKATLLVDTLAQPSESQLTSHLCALHLLAPVAESLTAGLDRLEREASFRGRFAAATTPPDSCCRCPKFTSTVTTSWINSGLSVTGWLMDLRAALFLRSRARICKLAHSSVNADLPSRHGSWLDAKI